MEPKTLKALIALLACADKPGTIAEEDREILEKYADEESKKLGYGDWIEALHKL